MRKFLASVGNAKLLGKVNGKYEHIADVRTLTESSLSFSNTQEEIRAGEGAQLMGRFSHDSGMTVTLTDAMFNLDYIEKQVGATLINSPTAFYSEEGVQIPESGEYTLKKTAQPIGNACGLDHKFCWVRKVGCGADAEWTGVQVGAGNTITVPQFKGETVCVEYFITKPEARGISINANFIPAELILILTTKLFAGDANAPETGKPVGSITVKIPRFSLDGTFDLSMAMSSAATMSLAGTALAVESGNCDGVGVYAEIVEVETNSDVTTGLKQIVVDEDTVVTGATPVVYGLYADGHVSVIENSECTFDPALTDGKFATGSYIVTCGDNEDTVTVA